jgi:DHA1 family multidrug resistance protein-like MFS transporter
MPAIRALPPARRPSKIGAARIAARAPWLKEPWQRNLAVVWIAEFVALSGFSIFSPFMPYFVQELGVKRLEEVEFWSGLLITANAVAMATLAPLWGSLADRYGRKSMVVRAMFGGAVGTALMGLTQNVGQLVALRALQGALAGTVAAATTLVASSTPPERRGYALGVLQTAVYLGNSVGPMFGGQIADRVGYRPTFWVTAGFLFSAGLLAALFVHEEFVSPEKTTGGKKVRLWDGMAMVLHIRPLLIVFGVGVLMRMGMRTASPMLPLFVQQIAPPGTRIASFTGNMEGFAAAASAVSAVLLGRVSDRMGSRRVILACGALACLASGLMSRAQNPTQLLLLRALTGAAMGGILVSISTLLAALAPKERFGAVFGTDTCLVSAANAIAPMVGAFVAANQGLSSVFVGAAIMYAIAILVVVAVGRRLDLNHKPPLPSPLSPEP